MALPPSQVVKELVSRKAMAMDYVDGEPLPVAAQRLTQAKCERTRAARAAPAVEQRANSRAGELERRAGAGAGELEEGGCFVER